MRRFAFLSVLLMVALTGCHGGSASPPIVPSTPGGPTLALNPSPLELTSDAPAAVVTAQNDVAGVSYTPQADTSCTTSTGAIAVAGDGVSQIDVAGSPLLFVVVATGTPPPSCNITVFGSDGSKAIVEVDYSTITVDAVPLNAAAIQRVTMAGGTVTPSSVTISKPGQVVMVNASGFNGLTKSSVSCSNAKGGVSVIPSSFTGSGTIAIAPYGQGALSGTCTVTFTDSTSATSTLGVTLSAAALNKLTITPDNVQFACAGSSPQTCTTGNVAISETDAQKFVINTRPALVKHGSCAASFVGPLKMTTGNGMYASSIAGPQATVAFYGLLGTSSLNCTKIVIGDGTQTVAVSVNSQLATGTTVASAPGCTGTDPLVADPNAPHGMYVWNPYKVQNKVNGGTYETLIEQNVIGKDPNLCGVSLVISWAEVETSKGVYDYSTVNSEAAPYAKAGLRVNLLFADAAEVGGSDGATPSWVFTQDGVQQFTCNGQSYPDWLDPNFESDYETFIAQMAKHFSAGGSDPYVANIGYMRFGIGAGVEAYPGHVEGLGVNPHPCLDAWTTVKPAFSYAAWLQHTLNIINTVVTAQQAHPDKQLMIPLNYVSTYDASNPNDVYVYANAAAAAAAAGGVAFGTENLGTMWGKVWPAGSGVTPTACNPTMQYVDAYWCQAFNRHVGVVPFEFQPIVSPIDPLGKDETMANWLQLALLNNAQLLEIYPQDWVFANDPSEFPSFTAATQAQYQAAFSQTSLILGRSK